MTEFNIGDRVKWGDKVGTVVGPCTPGTDGHHLIEFDPPFEGHNGNGFNVVAQLTSNRGYYVYDGYDGKKLTVIKKAPPHDGADEYDRILVAQKLVAELSR